MSVGARPAPTGPLAFSSATAAEWSSAFAVCLVSLRQTASFELIPEVTALLTEALEPAAPRSILELRGLGKELWRDIDAADYVASERTTWR